MHHASVFSKLFVCTLRIDFPLFLVVSCWQNAAKTKETEITDLRTKQLITESHVCELSSSLQNCRDLVGQYKLYIENSGFTIAGGSQLAKPTIESAAQMKAEKHRKEDAVEEIRRQTLTEKREIDSLLLETENMMREVELLAA